MVKKWIEVWGIEPGESVKALLYKFAVVHNSTKEEDDIFLNEVLDSAKQQGIMEV